MIKAKAKRLLSQCAIHRLKKPWLEFQRAAEFPDAVQLQNLMRLIRRNAATSFGRERRIRRHSKLRRLLRPRARANLR